VSPSLSKLELVSLGVSDAERVSCAMSTEPHALRPRNGPRIRISGSISGPSFFLSFFL